MDGGTVPPMLGRQAATSGSSDIVVDVGRHCVRVAQSCLHGLGVFAARKIPPSTFIADYEVELLNVCPRDRTYVMRVTVDERANEYIYIDAHNPTASNFTRFLNDPGPSCRANCEFLQNDLCIEVWTCHEPILEGEELQSSTCTGTHP